MTIYLSIYLSLPLSFLLSSCTEYLWKLAQVIVQLDISQFQLQINLLSTPYRLPCSCLFPHIHTFLCWQFTITITVIIIVAEVLFLPLSLGTIWQLAAHCTLLLSTWTWTWLLWSVVQVVWSQSASQPSSQPLLCFQPVQSVGCLQNLWYLLRNLMHSPSDLSSVVINH